MFNFQNVTVYGRRNGSRGDEGHMATEHLFVHLLEKTNKSVFICGWESMCRRKEGNIVEAGLSEAHLASQHFPQG